MQKLNDSSLFKQQCLIDGQWLGKPSGHTVYNPYDSSVLGQVPNLDSADIERAIASAQIAFESWRGCLAAERSKMLQRWHQLILENSNDLARIITLEQGKPLKEAQGEVAYAASFVAWYAEQATRINGEIVPSHLPNSKILIEKQPVGVVAAITPWNFPAAMMTRKCAPAIAAGCSVIVKPSPDTPFTALALAELAQRAGFPKGLLQVVCGDAASIGQQLCISEQVTKLSFTGSTHVGKLLMVQSANTVKRLSLELGGNAPFIVFDDADIEQALDGLMIAKFRNSGQTCVAANRIFVQSGIYHRFAAALVARVEALKIGNGLDSLDIAPLIHLEAAIKVKQQVEDALQKGGELLSGSIPSGETNLLTPMVLINANDEWLCSQQETFGPMVPLYRFDTEQEVIERANATESGLAAYAYSQDIGRCLRLANRLEAGMVGLNQGLLSSASAPFGGVKQSGLGREGAEQGVEEYLETKYVLLGGNVL
ncbi:NAD-dependent succinate-semialdehyde dehydrogenase [Vibrio intestinalis]|uniref:NAD-dependent succinate-semialdehyde dehydrogenase n=1 Tax=Vibrio intestinalis TaxID=2933291 RepID=UPI0021A44D04|nr:NAD-dependent succinate-semialdehyde dehydrogenase [Vibrio intestinalis]